MKSFRHPELDALGTCKACCKGLCGTCFTETDGSSGLACKNSCEKAVLELPLRRAYLHVFAAAVLGSLFLAIGLFGNFPFQMSMAFIVIASGVFIVDTVVTMRLVQTLRKISMQNIRPLSPKESKHVELDTLDAKFKELESESGNN
jgi:hypothetical protein